MRRRALSVFAFAVVMLVAAKASASFHYMKIVEVFAGAPAAPNAHYVQLQMYFAGQNLVSAHTLHVYNDHTVSYMRNAREVEIGPEPRLKHL